MRAAAAVELESLLPGREPVAELLAPATPERDELGRIGELVAIDEMDVMLAWLRSRILRGSRRAAASTIVYRCDRDASSAPNESAATDGYADGVLLREPAPREDPPPPPKALADRAVLLV